MFKIGSFEKELLENMESNLKSMKVDNKYQFNKISKAADYLNAAAELFEKAGMIEESDLVCNILNELFIDLSKKVMP